MIDVNEYLKNFYKGTKNLSLKTMRYFMNKYNNFESKMKFIHIAGTNGKGSCTEIISSILVKQGYKVGKFLSPHLIRYSERISINNKEITDEEMLNLINELNTLIDKYNEKEKINEMNQIIDEYIEYLGIGLSNLINIFEPDAICIGGSFVHYERIFMKKLENNLKSKFENRDIPKILLAKYGNDAGIVGAAMLKSN